MKFDRLNNQAGPVSEYGFGKRDDKNLLKQTLLLATVIFLISAPTPDSRDITEMTASFIATIQQSDASYFKVNE